MFRWLFGPKLVHYNGKYAIMKMDVLGIKTYRHAANDRDFWWYGKECVNKYCLIDSLEEAKKLLDVCVKHNKRVKE